MRFSARLVYLPVAFLLAVETCAQDRETKENATILAEKARLAFLRHDHYGARTLLEEKRKLDVKTFGLGSEAEAETLAMLAEVFEDEGNLKRVQTTRQEILKILGPKLGMDHWRVRELNQALTDHLILEKLPFYQRKEVVDARSAENQLVLRGGGFLGQNFKANTCAVRSLCSIHNSPLGASKATGLFQFRGDPEPTLLKILKCREGRLGAEHPHCALTWNNLAAVHYGQGKYDLAEKEYLKAIHITTKAYGIEHPDVANAKANLALLHHVQGRLARASELFLQARQGLIQAQGKESPALAMVLNNEAGLFVAMGDFTLAESSYQRAIGILSKTGSEYENDRAAFLSNLAALYSLKGDTKKAMAFLEKAIAPPSAPGKDQTGRIAALLNLAQLQQETGQFAAADKSLRDALSTLSFVFSTDHPDYASALHNHAMLCLARGDLTEAEKRCLSAQKIRAHRLPESHPAQAISLAGLASIHAARGDLKAAHLASRDALILVRRNLTLTFAAQSERQQLAMASFFRQQMDSYLSLALAAKASAQQIYRDIAPWRGMVFARQQHVRMVRDRSAENPKVAALFAEWEGVAARLAALAWNAAGEDQIHLLKDEFRKLTTQRENLERELSAASDSFALVRGAKEQDVLRRLDDFLPNDTALIDYVEYLHLEPQKDKPGTFQSERRLLAFVLKPGSSMAVIPLGLAEPVGVEVKRWRDTIGSRFEPTQGTDDPATRLRSAIWQPLSKYIEGTKTVLIAPDGPLCAFPFAALPGNDSKKYLLEELAVVNLPTPLQLPDLVETNAKIGKKFSLLVVGNVNYGPLPAEVDAEKQTKVWKHLPGTEGELSFLRNLSDDFPDSANVFLQKKVATKAALTKILGKHRWVHLATHGFFDPDTLSTRKRANAALPGGDPFLRQGPTSLHPGLLSGLVLAGANDPKVGGAGYLTALEVAQLDLRGVEMVTLSACSSGLGNLARGEGLLSLQRAFHVAGSKTVIASLWDVQDAATRDLMTSMYKKLWDTEKPLSRIEALRQAQLDMLREGPKRGFVPDNRLKARLAPPSFWAAFVLSGEWR